MEYKRLSTIGKITKYAIVLESGENLNEELEGLFLTLDVGAIDVPNVSTAQFDIAQLGFYDAQRGGYDYVDIPRPGKGMKKSVRYSKLEPVALGGNVLFIPELGKPFFHCHGGFCSGLAKDNGAFIGGGHISKAIVGRTCEGFITVYQKGVNIARVMNSHKLCGVRVWNFDNATARAA